jgi:hypothetical protein
VRDEEDDDDETTTANLEFDVVGPKKETTMDLVLLLPHILLD